MVSMGHYEAVMFEIQQNNTMKILNIHGLIYSDNFLDILAKNNNLIISKLDFKSDKTLEILYSVCKRKQKFEKLIHILKLEFIQ